MQNIINRIEGADDLSEERRFDCSTFLTTCRRERDTELAGKRRNLIAVVVVRISISSDVFLTRSLRHIYEAIESRVLPAAFLILPQRSFINNRLGVQITDVPVLPLRHLVVRSNSIVTEKNRCHPKVDGL